MNRRAFLKGTTAAGITVGVAGCVNDGLLGSSSSGAHDNVVLDTPELYEELRSSRDEGYLGHPIHGDELPEATVPDALGDSAVTTTNFVGDSHVLMTFIFTRCTMVCQRLTANLTQVQADAIENGYEDEFVYLPTTFDPEYDTPERLKEYSEDRGGVVEHDNWYFLRPEDESRAREVVEDTFGVWYDPLTEDQREDRDMPDNMVYDHSSSIILANKDGYIERNYTGDRVPNAGALLQDVEQLQERW